MLTELCKRYKLVIEYSGTQYYGWQRQPSLPTIQESLELAIQRICRQKVVCTSAGRTDTGVHALGQVVHVDIPDILRDPGKALFFGVNEQLSRKGIVVVSVEEVDQSFHARFSAKKRTYLYRILDRPYPSALEKDRVWFVRGNLNIDLMQEAANFLLGEHDFASFQSSGCSAKTSCRRMYVASVDRQLLTKEVHVRFAANAFLYHQVRNMVGSLFFVGSGRMSLEGFKDLFVSKDPRKRVRMAPAHGLYFVSVDY